MGEGAGGWVNEDVKKYPYDPEKAEQLLDEAGYPRDEDGVRFEFEWLSYDRDYAVQSSEIIKEFLQDVGIMINIQPVEYVICI